MTLKLEIIYEGVAWYIDNFIPPGNFELISTKNGYYRYPITGRYVPFFKTLPSGAYHIVICEIDVNELVRREITYDDLCKNKFELTF